MKTYTLLTLSAAFLVLGSTSLLAQRSLSPIAATTLESFDKGATLTMNSNKLPFEKQVLNLESSVSGVTALSISETQLPEDSRIKHAPTINTHETWGEWQDFGVGTYTRGSTSFILPDESYSFKVALRQRKSTVSGHEDLYQIKVENAFSDNDLIFWWDKNTNLVTNELSAEDVAINLTVNGELYKSVQIDRATYVAATGTFSFRVSYLDAEGNGRMFNESIVLDGMPTYEINITSLKPVYKHDEDLAQFRISCSSNIKTLRYCVVPEIDSDFSGVPQTLSESDFVCGDFITVDAQEPELYVEISGYQTNTIYMQLLNDKGIPVEFNSYSVVSTQSDGLEWETLGYGTLSDFDLEEYFVEDAQSPLEWEVMLQQCKSNNSLYRLVNPYTNENSPFRVKVLSQQYSGEYNVACDLTQNYYTYFKVDNLSLVKGSKVTSYIYPSGLFLSHKTTGDQMSLNAQKFVTFAEDRQVSSYYSSFTFPEYTDFSFSLNYQGEGVVAVSVVTDDITLKYQIEDAKGNVVVALKDVPDDLCIHLKNEGLDKSSEFVLVVMSYDYDGHESKSKRYFFNLGMTDWVKEGSAVYTYTTYYEMTSTHDVYKRHSVLDENHVQYRVNGWMYSDDTNFIIDIPDVKNVNADGNIIVYVPELKTTIVNADYGEVYAADAYSYSGFQQFLTSSYFNPTLGEFQLYNVYYVKEGYFDVTYETLKLDNYPDLKIIDDGQTMTDSGYRQSFYINMHNIDHVNYGLYNANDYDLTTSVATLLQDKDAKRLTLSTYLNFEDYGEYILAVAAYDANGSVLKTATGSFYNIPLVDMTKWEYLGQAVFVDGWVLPGYTSENNLDYGWYVDAYVQRDNPDIVGLMSPYNNGKCKLGNYNRNRVVENMVVIDISDKNCVLIREQYSGFKSTDYGDIRIGNYEGAFTDLLDSKEEVLQAMESYNLQPSTLGDDGLITVPQCIIGYTGSDFGLMWQFSQTGYIVLPNEYVGSGVTDIVVDDNQDAPVEYFNLQGVRVVNPENGIYIRRQGSTVAKIFKR